jgi:hypothetical protein
MENMISLIVLLILSFLIVDTLSNSMNVIASVRGKKYDIEAETVADFTAKVESVVNLDAGQQSVLFRGKILQPTDVLSEVGVAPGDVLMVVKGRRIRAKQDAETDGTSSENVVNPQQSASSSPSLFSFPKPMSGTDVPSQIDMENAMKQMDSLLDSNVFEEYFKDEESLEKARLQLLQNLDQYDQAMPGFKAQAMEIASDPEKWRSAMLKAKAQIAMLREERDKLTGSTPPPSSPSKR